MQKKRLSTLGDLICITLCICSALSTSATAAKNHPNVLLINGVRASLDS